MHVCTSCTHPSFHASDSRRMLMQTHVTTALAQANLALDKRARSAAGPVLRCLAAAVVLVYVKFQSYPQPAAITPALFLWPTHRSPQGGSRPSSHTSRTAAVAAAAPAT